MSRSFKKTPILKDHSKGMKSCANRKVRKSAMDLPDGKAYRKVFPSYDITDWLFRTPKEEYKANVEDAFLRARLQDKSYLRPLESLKDIESIDFERITLHELNDKIDYNRWRRHYYSK